MLKKLILENWKSFCYAELPLDPLTVLIGTNASGKSNVVEALEFLQRIANGENIETALAGDKTLPSIRGGIELAARKGENEFSLKLLVSGEDDEIDYLYSLKLRITDNIWLEDEHITIYKYQNKNEISQTVFSIKSFFQKYGNKTNLVNYSDFELIPPIEYIDIITNPEIPEEIKKNIVNKVRADKDFANKNLYNLITHLIVPKIQNILVLNPISSKMRDYSRLSENIESDGSNIAGVLAGLPDEKKTEIENTLSEYLKDLPEGDIKKVWAEKVGRFGYDAMLYCQEEWKPGEITEIDARSMSDGTLRFLAILTALLTRPEGSQIVIEEIDNGLHPSRAALLVKILKEIGTKRNIDILLTGSIPIMQ